jgi:hypothetical protein
LKKEIRMKKALRCSVPLLLALVLGTGMAIAADLAPAVAAAPVCATASPAPVALPLFTPEAQTAAICPLIGCANDEYCRRDRDCTTAAGGVCNLFCPTKGCCSYPGQ